MKKTAAMGAALLLSVALGLVAWGSSHREAPMISTDPQADNTDVYAFTSPEAPNYVTLIQNVNPLSVPAAGPYFYRFGDDVVYEFNIDNDGNGYADIKYQFVFRTQYRNADSTFLYNTGQVTSLDDPDLQVVQYYDVYEVRGDKKVSLGKHLITAPWNVGQNSMPDYPALREEAVKWVRNGIKVFAGPADDPFFIDLRIFDLLQPIGAPKDGLAGYNVSTIAIKIPKSRLEDQHRSKDDPNVIGVWATTSRYSTPVLDNDGSSSHRRKLVQVSRLGMPLFNEVIIPTGEKDEWNMSRPRNDREYQEFARKPMLAVLLNGIFGVPVPPEPREDLYRLFFKGLDGLNRPDHVRPAEMLRLNLETPVTGSPNRLGALGGDNQGYPNGRRLADDALDISLRAVAGALVPGFENTLGDGVDANDVPFEPEFPYVALPHPGNP